MALIPINPVYNRGEKFLLSFLWFSTLLDCLGFEIEQPAARCELGAQRHSHAELADEFSLWSLKLSGKRAFAWRSAVLCARAGGWHLSTLFQIVLVLACQRQVVSSACGRRFFVSAVSVRC